MEEDYKRLVVASQSPLVKDDGSSYMQQFADDLPRINKVLKSQAQAFNLKAQSLLRKVESKIGPFLVERQVGSLSGNEDLALCDLMKKKQELLAIEEAKWRLKSRVIWLKECDNNTKFFHKYASYRKNLNSIQEIKDQNGQKVSSFEEIAEAREGFFSSLFKEPEGCPIAEILKVIDLFLGSFSKDMNESLQDEISKGKNCLPCRPFKKVRAQVPMVLLLNFFLDFLICLKMTI